MNYHNYIKNNKELKKSNSFSLNNSKNFSSYFTNKNFSVNNNYNSNNNIFNIKNEEFNDNNFNFSNLNENKKAQINLIINLFEDLGVTNEYQNIFINYIINLNDEQFNKYLELEKKNLLKFRNILLNLNKEIISREENINNLKNFENVVLKTFNIGYNKLNNSILDDIIICIKAIQLNSIKIVILMNKINKINSFSNLKGKINLDKINKNYLYNKDYLIKMNDDVQFLENSELNKYIQFNNAKLDTFFLCCNSNENNINFNNKRFIPVDDETKNSIIKCKYILSQEKIFRNIELYKNMNDNNNFFNNNNFNNFFDNKNDVSNINNNSLKFSFKKDSRNLFLKKNFSSKIVPKFPNKLINKSLNPFYTKNNTNK